MLSRSILLSALVVVFSTITTSLAATTCNGHAELCDRLYSNVTFIGAHDSYGVGENVADNQDKDVTQQLTDGVRTLQVQAHNASDGPHLCHTSCTLLDGGLLSDYLTKVATWMSSNTQEVVTLVLVNSDDLPPTSFTSAFTTAGLDSKVYSPSSSSLALSDWPTLGTLIDNGTPLVVFMDYEADFSSVPWIIDEFSNMFEDAYDVTDTTWGCAVNRTSGSASSQMMLVNHFLDTTYTIGNTQFWVPDKDAINTTNSEDSIGSHVTNCLSLWGRNPNHILLDYYDSNGDSPFDLVANLNSVSAPTNTVTAGTVGSTASASSSGTGTGNVATASGTNSKLSAAGRGVNILGGPGVWIGMAIGALGIVGGGMGLFI
ncbi:PLC-like phosphodiesterase [Naematelia encephala]|uniref:PLC-like phosphodiesterase n=1 Tax=Naematelia encephala TaxID=71784 RepID=A0A1Y2BJ87_9TREE|nr:PLC-like phosphodiesterase [Naematelia encephala]